MAGDVGQVSWYFKVGATILTAPHKQCPGCKQPAGSPAGTPPKRQTSAPLSPLPKKDGCSFNLNNCCQGFDSDSFVSETGSLVSRGLSGEHPTPPFQCCQGTSTRGTLCTSFCSFLSPFVFQNTRPGLAEPLCAPRLCRHRWGACAQGCAACTPKGLCSATMARLSCLCSLFQRRWGERLFCWTAEHLVGQFVPLCHRDLICILRSQLGRSVLGFPQPGGHLEEGQTWAGETEGE